MEIIPAIDIKDGKCVRLYQGDYDKVTIYSTKPKEVALSWQGQGATRLHIVDLDAAASGKLVNIDVIRRIKKIVTIPLQVGGGLRNSDAVRQLSDIGIQRFILGSAAIESPSLVEELSGSYGDRIIVSIDARDGKVQIGGWLKSSSMTAGDLVSKMKDMGISRFVVTDISRDGTLSGPNFKFLEDMIRQSNLKFIASGGISRLEHISWLRDLGFEAAIVGKALYSGDIKLKEAMDKAKDAD